MVLKGARVASSANNASRLTLSVRDGLLRFCDAAAGEPEIDLTGYLLLPGLINSYDRFETAAGPAEDLPLETRLRWGGVRSLLSGVTTVAYQGISNASLFEDTFPVRVVRELGSIAPGTPPTDFGRRFWKHPSRWPLIISQDAQGLPEVAAMDKMGVLDRHTILANPAVRPHEIEILQRRQCSLIWWPISGRSPVSELLNAIPAAIGTGASENDLLDEIRTARLKTALAPEAIYRMVTSSAAAVLRLKRGSGSIIEGGPADLVAVRDDRQTPAEAIFDFQPQLVIAGGRIRLISAELARRAGPAVTGNLRPVRMHPRETVWLDAPAVPAPGFRLSGRPFSYSPVSYSKGT